MSSSQTERLFADVEGAGPATLVFLHGFGASHTVWTGIAKAFAGKHRTIRYDLPGHAGSLNFAGGVSAKAAARAVLADLTERGIESAHVVGHSLGGAVATLMAAVEPPRIASLTLLAPGGYGPDINGGVLSRYAQATSVEEIQDCLAAMSGPQGLLQPDIAKRLKALRAVPGQTARLVEIAQSISVNDRQGSFPPELLAGLPMPISIVWGDRDPVLSYSHTQNLPKHAMLTTVKGAGHMLIEEAPLTVIDMIFRSVG